MKWADAAPSSRTQFEQFLLENFGFSADLSSGEQLIVIGVLALAVPALFLLWAKSSAR